jgi:hypothetical protein
MILRNDLAVYILRHDLTRGFRPIIISSCCIFVIILLGRLFGLQFALVLGTTSTDPRRLKFALAVACAKNDGFREHVTETLVGRSRACARLSRVLVVCQPFLAINRPTSKIAQRIQENPGESKSTPDRSGRTGPSKCNKTQMS